MAGMMYLGNQKVTPVIVQGGGGPVETPRIVFKLADDITTVSQNKVFYALFFEKDYFSFDVDLNNLETISGRESFAQFMNSCPNSKVKANNIRTISGDNAMSGAFWQYDKQTVEIDFDFSKLETVSGKNALADAFGYCYLKNPEVHFTNLHNLTGSGALGMCFGSTNVSDIYFDSLTTQSFGSYTNQFSVMLFLVEGCTVHFPSNLESVIGEWSDVLSGFGGTNTTVLFDLEATS